MAFKTRITLFVGVAAVVLGGVGCGHSPSGAGTHSTPAMPAVEPAKPVVSPMARTLRNYLIKQTSPGQKTYRNADLAIEYGHLGAGMEEVGLHDTPWEIKDADNPNIDFIETGVAMFKGRRLPAGIIQAHIVMLDRLQGVKKTNFILIALALDEEFGMYRYTFVITNEKAEPVSIAQWKAKTSFIKS